MGRIPGLAGCPRRGAPKSARDSVPSNTKPSVANIESRRQRGFTLLEMIVVLMIIAMAATLLGTSIVGRLDGVKVATAARDLTAALRYTRSQAILQRKEQYLEVDLEHRSYLAPGRAAVQLPQSLELKLLTASSEVSSDKVGRIRFFSDGGSTGGRVTLIAGERAWKVNVSWLTGEIAMDDGRKEPRP
jgi:general secretion pathway protein H